MSALLNAKKYIENIPEKQRDEVAERIEYFLILNDHIHALADNSSGRCAQLKTIYSRWLNFDSHVSNSALKARVQNYLKEAGDELRGCP